MGRSDQEPRARPSRSGDARRPGGSGREARRSARGRPGGPRPGSTTATGVSSAHQPRIGVTAKLLGGSHSSGSSAKTSTPSARRPVSSSASRSAACRGVSPGSREPPGNDTCPGWERMSWARSVSSRSCCDPNRSSTAPRRLTAPSGGTNRVRSSAVISPRPVRRARASRGSPGRPEVLLRGLGDVLLGEHRHRLDVDDRALRVEEDRQRQTRDVGQGLALSRAPFVSARSG